MFRSGRRFLLLAFTGGCALGAVGILAGLVWTIAGRGWSALSWTFFTEQIRLVGASGGIFWNLVGTLILVATAAIVCVPLAVSVALLEGVWLRGERARSIVRGVLYTLNGLPSIVFGIFGFVVFVIWCGWGKSWLSGGLVLGFMILPTVALSLSDRLRAVPRKYVEAAAGLGLSQAQIVWSVLLPQARSGLVTGGLLGLARAAGETAPIMFTATVFTGATWPKGVVDSAVLSLPYHIFNLAQDSFDPGVAAKVWGTALVLLGLVLSLSLAALPSRLRMHEEAHG